MDPSSQIFGGHAIEHACEQLERHALALEHEIDMRRRTGAKPGRSQVGLDALVVQCQSGTATANLATNGERLDRTDIEVLGKLGTPKQIWVGHVWDPFRSLNCLWKQLLARKNSYQASIFRFFKYESPPEAS